MTLQHTHKAFMLPSRATAFLAIAVVPRKHEHDWQADQERERGELLELLWPAERLMKYSRSCNRPQEAAT
jgi:hypothetical protein